jgi:hypothetical protein
MKHLLANNLATLTTIPGYIKMNVDGAQSANAEVQTTAKRIDDVDGKGHKSLHSPEEQTVLWISLPHRISATPRGSSVFGNSVPHKLESCG